MSGISIIQENPNRCYLCGGSSAFEHLDKHHIYGSFNRDKSEQYGLFVYLCHTSCHIFGRDSVHQSRTVRDYLERVAQEKAMETYNWSVEDFIEIFGRSSL